MNLSLTRRSWAEAHGTHSMSLIDPVVPRKLSYSCYHWCYCCCIFFSWRERLIYAYTHRRHISILHTLSPNMDDKDVISRPRTSRMHAVELSFPGKLQVVPWWSKPPADYMITTNRFNNRTTTIIAAYALTPCIAALCCNVHHVAQAV